MNNLGIIELMRGDSFSSPIVINIGSKLYPNYYKLQGTDKLYFGLMEPNQAFEDAVMKKRFTIADPTDSEGNTLLVINPKDTEKLLVGKYYYMIKLVVTDAFGNEQVRTVVPPTLFWLLGNNPTKQKVPYFKDGEDEVPDRIIFEGGEIV